MKTQPHYIRIFAYSLVTVVLLIVLEVSFFYFTSRYPGLFQHNTDKSTFNRDNAEKFITSVFEAELGWDDQPIARNFREGKRYLAVSFGDSFTRGDEVSEHETWQAAFENITGSAVLNMGIGAYGIDQAVLKFEKYAPDYPSSFCILGINPEMYRRTLSYHGRYYFDGDGWHYVFKPVFIRNNRQFELHYPPCSSSECLANLLRDPDPELLQFLETHDYWYRDEQEKPVRSFPYTISFLKSIPRLFRMLKGNKGLADTYFMNEYSFDLVRYLIRRFAQGCRQQGASPLVLVLNGPKQLAVIRSTGKRWDRRLLEYLEENSIPFVDTSEIILEKYPAAESFGFLASPHWHFNAEGNNLIATALADHLARQARLPGAQDN